MNRFPIEKAIKEEMGADVIVKHKIGIPLTVQSEIDGKKGARECLPLYYNCPSCVSEKMCPGAIKATALNAKAIKTTGAPDVSEMQR